MTLTKSLLLGSAAGLLAVSGASAADLPSKSKGPAVEYVRICDTYGAGYFYIPGTDTCLKISGYARADYAVRNVKNQFGTLGGLFTPNDDPAEVIENDEAPSFLSGTSGAARHSTGFSGLGGLELDARSQTSWGTLRGFIRYEIFNGNGVLGGSGAALDKGFVQFAGVTAGRVQSFFTFYGDAYPLDISRGEDSTTTALAYTASFGGGFSATISIEDPVVRRGGIGANSAQDSAVIEDETFRQAQYGGSKLPDVVAQLRVDQAWGKAQLSGALHQINTVSSTLVGAPKATSTGWAVQAGVVINLPQLAAGDEIYVQGGYAVGAKSYLGLGNLGDRTNGVARRDVDAVAVATNDVDFEDPGASYRLEKGRGFNIQAGIKHFWAPNLKHYLFASYTTWNYGRFAKAADWNETGFNNGKELIVGTGLVWTPVKNLDLTFDLSYARLTQRVNTSETPLLGTTAAGLVPVKANGSSFTGRLRIQRAF